MDSDMPDGTLIRQLTPEDVFVLEVLANDAADFDMDGRTDSPLDPLGREEAEAFLSHPDVLFWVAEREERIDGFLLCYVQHRWHAPARELMLYEIGVRQRARRQRLGRALVETMETWMLEHGISDVWVPADNPGAEAFYRACGFERDDEQAVMMSKSVSAQ
jgi:ribosomal protein S18 acetylase RimI-like enzyme